MRKTIATAAGLGLWGVAALLAPLSAVAQVSDRPAAGVAPAKPTPKSAPLPAPKPDSAVTPDKDAAVAAKARRDFEERDRKRDERMSRVMRSICTRC